ncbi:uncharacterized protein yc1106_05475 [Curvularia clavata]|uniref:Uncharacterized protein n=1 Tax=Curvularia clavata TaxID=95742 RepID=A0A9Q9DU90_CURCL|nr:uncharacterized protein yc1106_05475 [Curvularia clavata]
MPTTGHCHTLGRSPPRTEEATTTKSRKPTTFRETRLERARPHVMLLAASLIYLTTALLAFQISIASVSNLKRTEYERVDDELRAHSSALRKEKIVYSRLDDLLSTRLRRNLMETHEECLVRGLKEAHYELIGLGFQYPDVREKITEWVTEECGRLQHSPQVVSEKPTPQEAVVTYWTNVSYRARRVAEETLFLIRQKLGWVFNRLVGSSQHEEASLRTDSATTDEVNHTNEPVLPARFLPPVPFGFALQCQSGHSCRLVYPGDSTIHINQPHVSPELLDKLRKRRKQLLTFGCTLDWFRKAVATVSCVMHYFEILFHFLCILMYGPCIANSMVNKSHSSLTGPKEETIYLVKSLMLEHFSAALLSLLGRKPRLFSSMSSAFPFALLFASIGLNMVLKLLTPGLQLESVINMYTSIRDLYSIIRDSDTAEEELTTKASTDGKGKQVPPKNKFGAGTSSSGKEKAPSSTDVCPPSKPHHRLANPETTVEQDIEDARQIMRQACARQTVDEWTDISKGFETDTESENDHDDAFVHIAGEATREASSTDDVPAWLMI